MTLTKSRGHRSHPAAIPNEKTVAATREPGPSRFAGRVFGGLILAAFVLYGVGSAFAQRSAGLALGLLNSIAVVIIGSIGFRMLRDHRPRVAAGYFAARLVEAVLLGGGIALAAAAGASGANDLAYQLAMLTLGVGSVPFFQQVGREGRLPQWFVYWGMAGYALLAAGALAELPAGVAVGVVLAIPGGVFELALGLYLLGTGFVRPPAKS